MYRWNGYELICYVFTCVCLSTAGWGGIPACLAGGIPACLAGLQGQSPGPLPRGCLQTHTWGGWFPGLHPGGLQDHTRWDVSQLPPPHGRLLPQAVRILLECILVRDIISLSLIKTLEVIHLNTKANELMQHISITKEEDLCHILWKSQSSVSIFRIVWRQTIFESLIREHCFVSVQ